MLLLGSWETICLRGMVITRAYRSPEWLDRNREYRLFVTPARIVLLIIIDLEQFLFLTTYLSFPTSSAMCRSLFFFDLLIYIFISVIRIHNPIRVITE